MYGLLERYQNGEVGYGMWLNTADSQVTEISTAAGYDWICLDLQHGLAEIGDLARLMPILEKGNASRIVRVLNDQADTIGRVLDLGAEGVIVPMIDTPEQAANAAAACRYPPIGLRSCGPTRAMAYDPAYLSHANDKVACIIMIETKKGFENVDAIAATSGVDALFVGPVDLSYALTGSIQGLQSAEFSEALDKILAAGKAANKPVGIFGINPENAKAQIDRGFDFCSVAPDTSLITSAIKNALAMVK